MAELRAGMTEREFMEWGMYYARQAQRAQLERLHAEATAGG